ncbi:MAG: sporulation sigma factor SigE, partial [Clostridia bacterium]|nr:sporulation sigma factor SigE [Clostridia bacterium]
MIRNLIFKILLKLALINPNYYINGPETLPEPLSADEESRLIALGDEQAKSRLIVHNLRLVVYIARKFEGCPTATEDLISIGTIGLIKAV